MPASCRLAAKQKRRLHIVFAVKVPCGTQMISSSIWHWLAATGKKINLYFCGLSNGLFLNLGATCFCSEWQARANRLQLQMAQDCEWATFPVAHLRASPSSQPPSLPKFISGISLPTNVSTLASCFTCNGHVMSCNCIHYIQGMS